MRTFFWLVLFVVYLLLGRWYFICEIRNLCDGAPTEEEDFRLKTLQFKDGDQVILRGYDHFRFDSASLSPVINENNFEFLGKVGEYLRANASRNLTITAGLREGETNIQKGFYDNLGIARADAIRSMFVENGIDVDRITLDYFVDSTNQLRRPIAFLGIDPSSDEEKGKFTFTHMTFSDANFEYNSAVFNPGEAFQNYADSVKIYFEQIDSVSLTIIGHTDSIASQQYNYRLGKMRADSARLYFINLGLAPERIATDSKGEEAPVAANKFEEGRQKNRRVDLVIQ